MDKLPTVLLRGVLDLVIDDFTPSETLNNHNSSTDFLLIFR
jgi:hypothetical protein